MENGQMPKNKNASFGGEHVVQENGTVRLVWYKRLSGWGFCEIYTAEGKLMAVLDYLGEVLVRDQEIPMRLEAETYTLEEKDDSIDIIFDVKSMVVQKLLDGTSFAPWMHYPFTRPVLEGKVTVSLSRKGPEISYSMRVKANENMYLRYLRGPWLKVGCDSFGTEKVDAIFPGIDWVVGKEWSSGNDWFRYPWSEKYAPFVNKMSIPCMAVSYGGDAIAISWDPRKWASRWFNYKEHYPQPVFAVPNFIDRDDNSLMGLMLPQAEGLKDENQIYAEPPMEVHLYEQFRIDAKIFLCKGSSSDAISAYVMKNGLPAMEGMDDPETYRIIIRKIAHHFNTNLWDEEKGFGYPQRGAYSFNVPYCLRRFVNEFPDDPEAAGLMEKIDFCDKKTQKNSIKGADDGLSEAQRRENACRRMTERADNILKNQREDGTFRFEPNGRHYMKDDFAVARVFAEPMGLNDDTALDMNMLPAISLLDIAIRLRDAEGFNDEAERIAEKALKAVDFCDDCIRPEGGDFWETPLHAANLYAAGHAAVASMYAYRYTGDEKYKAKAIYWIRTLLPFTHLWEPENVPMLYDTKPCLCSSDWYFANWVRDHVQWEVLAVFQQSSASGIKWFEIDKDIDWLRFQQGITLAAARWMVDHTKEKWMPHNIPDTYDDYAKGAFDGCFPDTHNSATGNYGGMFISPSAIADNLFSILDFMKHK
jgi:hypothetical protein